MFIHSVFVCVCVFFSSHNCLCLSSFHVRLSIPQTNVQATKIHNVSLSGIFKYWFKLPMRFRTQYPHPLERALTNLLTFSWGCWWGFWSHSGYGLSLWEEALLCNAFSHWTSPYPEWSIGVIQGYTIYPIKHAYVYLCVWERPPPTKFEQNPKTWFFFTRKNGLSWIL